MGAAALIVGTVAVPPALQQVFDKDMGLRGRKSGDWLWTSVYSVAWVVGNMEDYAVLGFDAEAGNKHYQEKKHREVALKILRLVFGVK